eukprot:12236160-Heterocapsa_arctica.AAC.1
MGGAVDGGHRWSNKQDTHRQLPSAMKLKSQATKPGLHLPLRNVGRLARRGQGAAEAGAGGSRGGSCGSV